MLTHYGLITYPLHSLRNLVNSLAIQFFSFVKKNSEKNSTEIIEETLHMPHLC